jgi:hypothetical protein
MNTKIIRLAHGRPVDAIFVWAVWGAMTVASMLFIRHYSRNIPYLDDFSLIPIMTGREPVSLPWLWSQHNEHRPVISRLIMAGLFRYISPDFRVPLYFNAGLIAATAAAMLILVRRLRGRTSLLDVALPLSILNIGQAETLLLGLTMALVLTSWISCELIRLASAPESRRGWILILQLGVFLTLLPLCSGNGLIMLPSLLVWLAYASICCSRREGDIAKAMVTRSIGVGLLLGCLVVATAYMWDFKRPPSHQLSTSAAAFGSALLEYLSILVWPNVLNYWQIGGVIVVFLVAMTLRRLCWIAWRQPEERPRALAMVSIILSMHCTAAAVGVARAFQGGRTSRYITTIAPLFCALYVTWLVYGSVRARRLVHAVLLALVVVALPVNLRNGREYGTAMRAVYTRVERSMKAHSSISGAVQKAWPVLHPSQQIIDKSFRMLKQARVGRFGDLGEDRLGELPNDSRAVR